MKVLVNYRDFFFTTLSHITLQATVFFYPLSKKNKKSYNLHALQL